MENIIIFWVDDEIDLFKFQFMFLEKKGYEVIIVINGYDVLEECDECNDIDVVFLDESMLGIIGLEMFLKIKVKWQYLFVVMIIKNEVENVMEEVFGVQIIDYFIKLVNFN